MKNSSLIILIFICFASFSYGNGSVLTLSKIHSNSIDLINLKDSTFFFKHRIKLNLTSLVFSKLKISYELQFRKQNSTELQFGLLHRSNLITLEKERVIEFQEKYNSENGGSLTLMYKFYFVNNEAYFRQFFKASEEYNVFSNGNDSYIKRTGYLSSGPPKSLISSGKGSNFETAFMYGFERGGENVFIEFYTGIAWIYGNYYSSRTSGPYNGFNNVPFYSHEVIDKKFNSPWIKLGLNIGVGFNKKESNYKN